MNKTLKNTLQAGLAFLMAGSLAACQSGNATDSTSASGTSTNSGKIAVLSREDGSGTRSAFVELFGLEEDGVDQTRADAEITNSTAVMMTTVGQNPAAIGYISLGSLDDSVKAVAIDGTEPSVENVQSGAYTVSRPFLIAQKEESDNPLLEDFKAYILSESGQDVIREAGYVPVEVQGTYEPADLEGERVVGGSSSVTPVMEKLAEAYQKENPNAQISVMQTDSTTGASGTVDGMYDLGMLSRELKPEEESQGLKSTVIATDGIAVIVNPSNTVDSLSVDQVKAIYTGQTGSWDELIAAKQ